LALLSFGLSWHFDQDAPLMGLTLSRFRDRIQAHLERLRAGQLEAGEPLLLGGNIVEFERQPAPPRRGASAWRPHIYEYPSAIRKRLDQKLNRFAPLKDAGVPFIVAIGDAMLEQPLERAVEDVLFISSRKDRPYFSGGHTRLSAVLTCEKHNLEEGVELELRVFHNPAAANPLPPDCLPDVPQVRASPIAGGAFQTEVVGPSDGRTWLRVPSDPHHEWRRGQ
jgi:hypothetical protein